MPDLPLISHRRLALPLTLSTGFPRVAITPAMIAWMAVQTTAPLTRRGRRPMRSMKGSMPPVVTKKMTYWIADDQRVVSPVYYLVS